MEKWYAVQVMTGKEQEIAKLCNLMIKKDILSDCFIPKYERIKRYQGKWHKEQLIMFPGYLFLETRQVDILFHKLKLVPELTKILGAGTDFIPLTQIEMDFIRLVTNKDYLVEMSVGYLLGKQIIITSGPLQKIGGIIRKIDRHKRTAVISVRLFGREQDVTVGAEIVRRVDKENTCTTRKTKSQSNKE